MPRLSLALAAFAICAVPTSALAQGWVDRTPINPNASPSPRRDAAMCWDGNGGVMLFGGAGYNVGNPNETWRWNGTAWTRLSTPTAPSPGGNQVPHPFAMVFHPPTNEIVLVSNGATYTWTGTDWLLNPSQVLSTSSFGNVLNLAMAHDPTRAQTVLYVGSRWNGTPPAVDVGETFVWDGFGWTLRPTAVRPFPAGEPSLTFDPVANKLLLTTSGSGGTRFWEWSGTNWMQRYHANAPAVSGATATDTLRGQVVMLDSVLDAQPHHTWTFAGTQSGRPSSLIEPARRRGAAMAFDPVRNRIVLFGGTNNPGSIGPAELGDTWEFELGQSAAYVAYGAGCAGSRGVPSLAPQGSSLPRVGQTFTLNAGDLPLTGPVFLFLGLSDTTYGPTPLPFSLGGLGAPGCEILAAGDALYALTNVLGASVWSIAIPNLPGVTFYNQAIALDPAANVLGLTVSNGGRGTIGL